MSHKFSDSSFLTKIKSKTLTKSNFKLSQKFLSLTISTLLFGAISANSVATFAQAYGVIGEFNGGVSQSSSSQSSSAPAEAPLNTIISNEDYYKIPEKFNSPEKIQAYFEQNNSLLANLVVDTVLEQDDPLLKIRDIDPSLQTGDILARRNGKMLASQLIWDLSVTNLANGCSLTSSKVCLDNSQKPINPAFLIALIQKESGLVYGKNAKLDPQTDEAKFLIDRAAGYYCMETSNKAESCFDENQYWKYYKGFFRQAYFATRFLNLTANRCEKGAGFGPILSGGTYYVGNKLQISGQEITPTNGITCALYAFTPHVSAQKFFIRLFEEISK